MDKIYIPEKPENISKETSDNLSELRVLLDDKIIDYEYSHKVSSYLLSKIDEKDTLIDFGCGGGFLIDVLLKENKSINKYIGLDAAKESLNIAKEKNKNIKNFGVSFNYFDKDNKINLESNSVDSIISCFVMHFPISNNQIEELYRVLKSGGCFIYNDFNYQKSERTTLNRINQLKKVGFKIKESEKYFYQNNKKKYHKIILAKKI